MGNHMTQEPKSALDYNNRATRAIKMVLTELGQILGEYKDGLVLVGGAVPWLLLPDAETPHVGTVDIDLALNPKKLENEGRYADLIRLLESAGYQRNQDDQKAFQLRKNVELDEGDPVPVTIDLLKPNKPKTKKNRPPLISGLRIQDVPGVEFALDDPQWLTIEGNMPDGRSNTVRLLITGFAAFLVMKGYALEGRDKPKDAYDIYFVIKNHPQGIEALAALCEPLMAFEEAKRGFLHIANKFAVLEGYGAQTVRSFLSDTFTSPEEADFVQRDAYEQVQTWLKTLGLVNG
jgi:hypothetical protein